jgi:hypothetical protein
MFSIYRYSNFIKYPSQSQKNKHFKFYCNFQHDVKHKSDGHIYVIKEREFIKTGENIFKIGRSKNIVNRMPGYPKNSLIYTILYTDNINEVEKNMIKHFDNMFIKRTDIGNEYYECSEKEIMQECTMILYNLYKD